jgi:hypothetical protein
MLWSQKILSTSKGEQFKKKRKRQRETLKEQRTDSLSLSLSGVLVVLKEFFSSLDSSLFSPSSCFYRTVLIQTVLLTDLSHSCFGCLVSRSSSNEEDFGNKHSVCLWEETPGSSDNESCHRKETGKVKRKKSLQRQDFLRRIFLLFFSRGEICYSRTFQVLTNSFSSLVSQDSSPSSLSLSL